ncbi:hypothetical protein CVD28_05600 [Bacillus sp. M6-12]|nr:hypothetical protein CVD28_05600 [Bacillus sp. M6-12]
MQLYFFQTLNSNFRGTKQHNLPRLDHLKIQRKSMIGPWQFINNHFLLILVLKMILFPALLIFLWFLVVKL